MPTHRLLTNGRNFLLEMDSHVARRGFYQDCFAEAESRELAEEIATRQIHDDGVLTAITRNP